MNVLSLDILPHLLYFFLNYLKVIHCFKKVVGRTLHFLILWPVSPRNKDILQYFQNTSIITSKKVTKNSISSNKQSLLKFASVFPKRLYTFLKIQTSIKVPLLYFVMAGFSICNSLPGELLKNTDSPPPHP